MTKSCSLFLQVKAGVDVLTLKRKYKEMAVTLHPDKCKVRGHCLVLCVMLAGGLLYRTFCKVLTTLASV